MVTMMKDHLIFFTSLKDMYLYVAEMSLRCLCVAPGQRQAEVFITGHLFKDHNPKFTRDLLQGTTNIRILVGLFIGHCRLIRHMINLKL